MPLPLDELKIFVDMTKPLTRLNHNFTSLGQVTRAASVDEDKGRRVFTRMAAFYGDPLVQLRDRRYLLTSVGKKVAMLGKDLISVGREEDADPPCEKINIEVPSELDPRYLAVILAVFLNAWGGLVRVRVLPIDTLTIRSNLANDVTTFGVGFAEDDGSSGAVLLARPVAWTVLIPEGHALAERQPPLPAEELTGSARVFLPARFADSLEASVGDGTNTIVVPTAEAVRAAVAAKLGCGLDLDFGVAGAHEPYLRLPVSGLKSLRLGLFLPRRPESVSEAAKELIGLIHSHHKLAEVGEPQAPAESPPE